MRIDVNNNLVSIEQSYPLVYKFDDKWEVSGDHESLAQLLSDHKGHISTYMFIVEVEDLAREHLYDPRYIHDENFISQGEAAYNIDRELTNKWYKQEELDELIKKHELPTWKYNYKVQGAGERLFRFELEDAIFKYQQTKEVVLLMVNYLKSAKYVLDQYGYLMEDENDDLILESDPKKIEKNKEYLLERYLMPKVYTKSSRVYDMPEPFNHWDSRSSWHQFFFVENHKTKETLHLRGQAGGSSSREVNGLWAHTFAQLEKVHQVKTPTWHLIYDSQNKLTFHASYDSFKSLGYDLTGNYQYDYKKSEVLFKDLKVESSRKYIF